MYPFTVIDKLTHEHDSEVSATSLRVSLICPVCDVVWSTDVLCLDLVGKDENELSV